MRARANQATWYQDIYIKGQKDNFLLTNKVKFVTN